MAHPKLAPLGLLLLALGASACGIWGEEIACPTPETVVSSTGADNLTCADLRLARTYVDTLASRSLRGHQLGRFYAAVRDSHQTDAVVVRGKLGQMTNWLAQAKEYKGRRAAEHRSHQVWRYRMSQGVFAQNDSSIRRIVSPHLAIWARSDEEKLALTEMDIEGWIRLASLCREVQGGTPLKMSVASSEQIYRTLSAEFDGLKRDDQLGRVAVGPFWPEVEAHWKSASYEQQQAWIRVTPLPPPMTATSRAYVDAVLELPPGKMSDVLHQVLGPFGLR